MCCASLQMENTMSKTLISAALLALLVAAAGCGNILSKPYPEKTRYAFAVVMPAETRPAGTLPPLRIATIRANPPYDGLSLVYKTGDSTFSADYYNTFVALPDRLLSGEVETYLSRCGVFSTVSSSAMTTYRYVLEGDVVQLYGDFTSKSAPTAVISMRFFLIDDENAAAKVLLQKTYSRSEPITAATPEALLLGWNRGLGMILGQLAGDIEATTLDRNTNTTEKAKP